MDNPSGKENPELPQLAGKKRPAEAPALLPAIDFLSSSPVGRPTKRQARGRLAHSEDTLKSYPTPVPSSSVGNIPSSPPLPAARPPLQRTSTSLSERAPLSTVPSVTLEENGDLLLMGRSSNSSHYQLSANRLISRVHVQARFIPPSGTTNTCSIEVICMGWNGIVLHSQGKTWTLGKEDTFTSETEGAEIMIDVQDARVILRWPERKKLDIFSESSGPLSSPSRDAAADSDDNLGLPRRYSQRLGSPVSPTPHHIPSSTTVFGSDVQPSANIIKIYEDEPSSDAQPTAAESFVGPTQSTFKPSQALSMASQLPGLSQGISQPDTPGYEEFSDQDEENDPIIASFGPQGDNLLPRMALLVAGNKEELKKADKSPNRGRIVDCLGAYEARSVSESAREEESSPLVNHVVNQLAFSRLSSTPLSAILSSLPADLKREDLADSENKSLTLEQLKHVLDSTRCIGEIAREGKDAAGKRLESEYYYIPGEDLDEKRRETIVGGLQKPGLRACRKQHKRYFWRRPK